MTPPRRILEGSALLLTRRCTQRQFLLQPCELTNAVVEYLLAHYATVNGIRVHAFCFLGDHYHIVLTDPKAQVCKFLQDLNGLMARALNALYGRRENFWSSEEANIVELIEPEDIVEKIVYTIANPVSSWLVERSTLWPGASSQAADVGTLRPVKRPDHYFRKNGKLPPSAQLRIEAPPGEDPVEFRKMLAERVAEREAELRRQRRAAGRSFFGLRRLYLQGPQHRATGLENWWKLIPRIACKNPKRRIEELARLKEFFAEYRAALRDFRSGLENVVFPAGTYKLRVEFGVRCAAPPPEG